MDDNQFKLLLWNLHKEQDGMRVGLITDQLLEEFVRLVNATEKNLSALASSEDAKFSLSAVLAPEISKKEYDNLSWNTPSEYRGPYTAVYYKNRSFYIKRYKSETGYYQADCKDLDGVSLDVEISIEDGHAVSLDSILGIFEKKLDLQRVYVSSSTEKSLMFHVWPDLEHLTPR